MVISPSDSSRRRNNKITEKAGSFKKVLCAGTGLGYNKENIQGKEPAMNSVETKNEVLVNLFNEIMDIEERALITPEYKDISVNDMHVIEAVGIRNPRSMSAIAKDLSVTVGTLTIAVNHLVKKGYINRGRSEEDRRVVLVSLSEKGEKAYHHHRMFHERMVMSVLKGLDRQETETLTKALSHLQDFFRNYRDE